VRRAGYLAATTTRTGYATPRDRFRLARVQVSRGITAAGLLRRLLALRPRDRVTRPHGAALAAPGGGQGA
jgi:hypothetical protein